MALVEPAAPGNDGASPALQGEPDRGRAQRELEQPMNVETRLHAHPHSPSQSTSHSYAEPIEVVTLFAPRGPVREHFEHAVAEWNSLGRAVLVVLPGVVDAEALDRLGAAGADLCVVAPTSEQLFSDVERARCLHRSARHAGELDMG